MKSFRLLLLLAAILFTCTNSWGEPEADDFGLGFLIGSMGAVNGKYFVTKVDAVDIGAEFMDHPWKVFYADYLRHFRRVFGKTRFGQEAQVYAGFGAGAGFWDRPDTCGRWNCKWNPNSTGSGNGFFVRLVGGLEWFPKRYAFSAFGEIAPSFMWYPSTGTAFDFSVGARYYF